ncbi:MAG: hypothetical protein DRP74_02900 [Candidatus Omnitrophota bacterium]|nr:MAG: hypothetical protein DRP74_02900 [Candidatus Omnitrophota bacterium]
MKKENKYKLAILILSVIVLFQAVLILGKRHEGTIEPEPDSPAAIKGKIAVVVDDWGYNLKNLNLLKEIQYPLSVAVLPGLAYSKLISENLHAEGFEVILHLPMQPRESEKIRLEKNTIMVDMDENRIKDIIELDLKSVPSARGVSNHMGSKATADMVTMERVFQQLKERKLFFLDSFVAGKTACRKLAKKLNLPFAQRDIFLDNELRQEYIEGQLEKLKRKAGLKGEAIGICHAHKVTLMALKKTMPEIEKQGYKFVFVSELVDK